MICIFFSPIHPELVQILLPFCGELAPSQICPLRSEPDAKAMPVLCFVSCWNIQISMLCPVALRFQISLFPRQIIAAAPDHPQLVQALDLLFGQSQPAGLSAAAEPVEPHAKADPISIDIVDRDVKIFMLLVICQRGGVIALKQIVRHIPGHTNRVQRRFAFRGEIRAAHPRSCAPGIDPPAPAPSPGVDSASPGTAAAGRGDCICPRPHVRALPTG